MLYGMLGAVDVRFDPMANTKALWNEQSKSYELTRSSESWSTIIHLADNSTTLQIGANESEDMILSMGDMSAAALGVDNVPVVSRELAARAVTTIDNAIYRVSNQRARLGAYQNRLEHTITNLTTMAQT
jgi:flagellin